MAGSERESYHMNIAIGAAIIVEIGSRLGGIVTEWQHKSDAVGVRMVVLIAAGESIFDLWLVNG